MAERLGIDVRHLARLVDKGVLTCRVGKRGREYPWPESRDAYLRYQIADAVASVAGRADDVVNLEKERALLVRTQRQEIELRLEEKAKKLVPYTWALEQQEALMARFSAVVKGWAARAQPDLVGLDTAAAHRVALAQEELLRKAFFELTGDVEEDDNTDETTTEQAA